MQHMAASSQNNHLRVVIASTVLIFGLTSHNQAFSSTTTPCLIEPENSVELGSPVVGIIETLTVERGDRVKKGQVIATLKRSVEQNTLAIAKNRASEETELRSALEADKHAKREQERSQSLFSKKLVTQQSLDKSVTEAELASLQIEQARQNKKLAVLEQDLAVARLKQRTIHTPFTGIIADRYLSVGQRVQDQPIVKIIQVDPLRVEVIVPKERFGNFKVGHELMVTPEIANLPSQQATIRIIDKIIDPASNTFRMTLTLPNPDHTIPSGARCSIDLDK